MSAPQPLFQLTYFPKPLQNKTVVLCRGFEDKAGPISHMTKTKKKKKDNDGSETERYGVGHTLVFHDQIMHVIFYVIMQIDGTI